jgi:hypothetical protein
MFLYYLYFLGLFEFTSLISAINLKMGGCPTCCSTKEPRGSEIPVQGGNLDNQKAVYSAIVIQSIMQSYLENKRVQSIKSRRSIQP